MSNARTLSDLVVQLQLLSRDIELLAAQRLEGTSLRAVSVLMCAGESEKSQREIAGLTCLDKSTMVHIVDDLEKAGLARREPSQKDRRARIVAVTDEGRELVASTSDVLGAVHEEVLARLPEADREPFLRSLATLVDGRSADSRVTRGR